MKNESLDMFRQMKLTGMADAYQAVLSLPINNHPDAHQLIAQLLDAEYHYRTDRRTKMYLRLSKLRYQASIQDIECSEKRNLSKEKLSVLADCNYINRSENILITGATSCGKSYLACALGHNACLFGHRTLYFNLNRFAEQISIAKTDGSLIKWLDKLKKASLIILDDFGLQPLSQSVKLALLQILEDRYAKASTLICSQLPINSWHAYLDEPTIADAIMDRLVPKAHKIDLKGESLRNRSKL